MVCSPLCLPLRCLGSTGGTCGGGRSPFSSSSLELEDAVALWLGDVGVRYSADGDTPVVVLGEWGLSRPHRAVLGKARITRNRLGQITDQAMRDLLDFAPIASRLFGTSVFNCSSQTNLSRLVWLRRHGDWACKNELVMRLGRV